jgi:hypothetical protein
VKSVQYLAGAIDEILVNTDSGHVDSLDNFMNLLKLLESTEFILAQEPDELSKLNRAMGCLELLLKQMQHSQLQQLSLKYHLSSSLFQALRLLRIIEVLGASNHVVSTEIRNINNTADKAITMVASQRICTLLRHLLKDSQVIEELRPNLNKLFCFPISKKYGYHLQRDSAVIVSVICKHSLSWSIIWFLHDNRVIMHMLTSLRDIFESKQQQIDYKAEAADLWLIGMGCVVDLVACSAAISGVLVQDYNASKGDEILIDMVMHSQLERVPPLLNLSMQLYFGCAKATDATVDQFPPILLSVLLATANCSNIQIGNRIP